MARPELLVDRHRNLNVAADPVRVLQRAYPRVMCDEAQDLGTKK